MDFLLSVWWISWLGILLGFLYVGAWEYRIESSRGTTSLFSLVLLIVVPLLWIAFFVADGKAQERTPKVVQLLTMIGTSLAALTLLGIWFFIFIAPRVR